MTLPKRVCISSAKFHLFRSPAAVTCIALLLVTHRATQAESPPPNSASSRFESEIAAFEAYDRQSSFPPNAVLFIGSSSIRLWPTAESFPDLAVINRGFGGSYASEVNDYADRIVLKYKPRTIVFYAGDNDVADGKSPQQVAHDFRQFAERVHKELPSTQIVFLPIKPSPLRWQKWPQAKEANSLIRRFVADSPWLAYVDTATPLLGSDGQPNREYYRDDELHLNDAGYRIWTDALRPELAQ